MIVLSSFHATRITMVALGLAGCREKPASKPPPDSGPSDTSEPELIPYVAEEICVIGDQACARLDDGAVACWGELDSPFVLDVDATKLRCASRVCVEVADGSIDCYDWDGEIEEDENYAPDPATLPFSDWWLNRSYVGGGCGVGADSHATCWPDTLREGFQETASSYTARHIGFTQACWMLTDTDGRIHSIWDGEGCTEVGGDLPEDTYGLETPPEGDDWQRVEGGTYHACALDSEGQATCWGLSANQIEPPTDLRFTELSSTTWTTCGVTTEGTIRCRGAIDKYMPTDIPTSSDWIHVAISGGRGCAIDEAGQIYCFGDWVHSGWYTYEDALALR